MPEPRPDDDLFLRHLADVQSVIIRLSQNSFIIRGWSVTLVSIIFAISGNRIADTWVHALIAVVPAIIFWGLDAYYLRRERLYRLLYDAIGRRLRDRADPTGVEPFNMDVQRFTDKVKGFWATLFTGHVMAIPGMLLSVIALYVVGTL